MAAKLQNSKSAKDELREAIRSLGTTMGLNNAFTKFLELTATALGAELDPVNAKVRDQQYEDAQKGLKPDELSEFARMTALMWLSVLEHQEEPIDILGDIYHSLRLNNEWNGQFFTPDDVARMMAMIVNPVLEQGDSQDYLTLNEPTCGSGTMVIASIWAMKKHAFDYRNKAFFVAQDIDIRCVWMAYIQLSLYGIPAVVIHGNTLTMETWSQWYTPCAAVPFMDIEQESNNAHRIDDEKGEAQCECESKIPVSAKEGCSNRQTA